MTGAGSAGASDTDVFDDLRHIVGLARSRAGKTGPIRDGLESRIARVEAWLHEANRQHNELLTELESAVKELDENTSATGLVSRAKLDEELQQIDDAVVALGGPRDQALTFLLALSKPPKARPLADYHEDFGAVLWWKFPIAEPPYVGSPNDSDWPEYHTHWTPLSAAWIPELTDDSTQREDRDAEAQAADTTAGEPPHPTRQTP